MKTIIKTSIKEKQNIYVKESVDYIFEELNKKGNFMFITTVSHAGNEKKAIIKKSLIKFAE